MCRGRVFPLPLELKPSFEFNRRPVMGAQSLPVRCWRPQSRLLDAKPSKVETNTKDTPAAARQSALSGRALPRTASKPLVPRRPWPEGVPAPSGRKGKSVSPSTPEKAIFTPPMTKRVEVAQKSQLQSQILKRTSSCGTSLHSILDRPMRGTNARTISAMLPCILHLAKKHILESYKESVSVSGKNHLHLSCAKDDHISCIQQNRAGTSKCRIRDVRSETWEEAEQSKRSDHNFKIEEMEEDTTNHTAEPSNSDFSAPCRCSICARHEP